MEKHLKLDFKKLGPKLGKKMQQVNQAIKAGQFEIEKNNKIKVLDDIFLEKDEYQIEYKMPEGTMKTDDGTVMVYIDMTETEAFKKEGIVRDLVRQIQLLRKEADFNVSDRIATRIEAVGLIQEAIEAFQEYIQRETLTTQFNILEVTDYEAHKTILIDGVSINVALKRLKPRGD